MWIGIETKRRTRTRTRTASRPGVSPGAPTQGAEEEEKEEEKNKEEEDEQKDQEEDKKETGNPGTRAHLVSTAPARAFPPPPRLCASPIAVGQRGVREAQRSETRTRRRTRRGVVRTNVAHLSKKG